MTAEEALQRLVEGNRRFVQGLPTHPHTDADHLIRTARQGQHPFVTVLTCSDSRVPVSRLFDQGVGDIFEVRVAGNVCGDQVAGSIEFGAVVLKTPLLVILGHSCCGAVNAVMQEQRLTGNIFSVARVIRPVVDAVRRENPEIGEEELMIAAIDQNARQAAKDLFEISPSLAKAVDEGSLRVMTARYDIETGEVAWLGAHRPS